jgi:hypothetical protein
MPTVAKLFERERILPYWTAEFQPPSIHRHRQRADYVQHLDSGRKSGIIPTTTLRWCTQGGNRKRAKQKTTGRMLSHCLAIEIVAAKMEPVHWFIFRIRELPVASSAKIPLPPAKERRTIAQYLEAGFVLSYDSSLYNILTTVLGRILPHLRGRRVATALTKRYSATSVVPLLLQEAGINIDEINILESATSGVIR